MLVQHSNSYHAQAMGEIMKFVMMKESITFLTDTVYKCFEGFIYTTPALCFHLM